MKQRMLGWLILIVAAALSGAAARGAEKTLTIRNESLEVRFDPARGAYSITALPSGKTFVKNGQLSQSGGKAAAGPAPETVFSGEGQAIGISYPDGSADAIVLHPKLPFALFFSIRHNGGEAPRVINKLTLLKAPLNLGPPEALRVLGTGGLSRLEGGALREIQHVVPQPKSGGKGNIPPTAPGDEFGSYVWLAVADPQTRHGVVGAWTTAEERGSGVVFPRVDRNGGLALEAQLQYGALRLAPGASAHTDAFVLGYFDDARLGLEAWADAVAKAHHIKLPPQPAGFCTWYMEKHQGASDEKHFAELSEYAARNLKPFGFDFVQIDDGWQAGDPKGNGPRKNFTAFRPGGPYPGGMKAAAAQATALGLTPGIWFMPFAGSFNDPYYADKQDLFARTRDGRPYDTDWGGTCLDMTNPKARRYLADEVRLIAHDWGYKLFKMDGMWTGTATPQIYVNSGYREDGMGDAVLHDPSMTNIQAYRAGLRTIRQAAGPGVFLLGCCVSQNMRSFGGAFGLVDGFRIGPDTGSGHIGSPYATRNYFIHGRIWYNDPDCVSVRAAHPLGNARANATFTAISGNLFYNSDWIPDLPAERLEILKRTMAPHGLLGRPVDIFEQPVARIWLLTDTRRQPRRDVAAFFNWDPKNAATIETTLARLGLDPKKEYVAFDFWENKLLGSVKDKISLGVPADACAVLALRPAADHPQLLGTSAHVTQGMVDVLAKHWDGQENKLTGRSRLIAGDPYELRIALPKGGKWKAAVPLAATKHPTARLDVSSARSEPGLARVTLTASANCDVDWAVGFAK